MGTMKLQILAVSAIAFLKSTSAKPSLSGTVVAGFSAITEDLGESKGCFAKCQKRKRCAEQCKKEGNSIEGCKQKCGKNEAMEPTGQSALADIMENLVENLGPRLVSGAPKDQGSSSNLRGGVFIS